MSLISRINDLAARIAGEFKLKQDKLVSGTNIKTINNESILGAGNITVQGGGGGGSSAPVTVVPDQDNVSTIDLSQGNYFVANIETAIEETPVQIPVQIVWSLTHSFGTATWAYLSLTGYQHQEGDILLLCVGSDGSTPALPDGFTNISNQTSGTEYTRTCYIVVGSSQLGSVYVWGVSTSSVAILICLRNVNLSTLMNITPMITTGLTGMPNPGGVTTIEPNSVVLTVGYLDDDNLTTVTPPADFSMIAFRAGSTVGQTVMAASRLIASPQTVVPSAFGYIGSPMGTDEWVAVTMVFEPKMGVETNYIYPQVQLANAPADMVSDVKVHIMATTGAITFPSSWSWNWKPDFAAYGELLIRLLSGDGQNWNVFVDIPLDDFIKRNAVASNQIDWKTGAIFTKTLNTTTNLTFANLQQNKVITFVVNGNHVLNLPVYCRKLSGNYDGWKWNYIQFHCTNAAPGSEEVWFSITPQAT